ncbi:MAG: hypothetical protein JSV21_11255 [Nitrospirota bacterium]|nr:MAG: hypothetical protein JSV21_11255 [Nitrospirota bacterium]
MTIKSKYSPLIAIIFFLAIGVNFAFAANMSEDFAFKISLENHLEKRLKHIITEITGSDRGVIIINADIGTVKGGDSNKGSITKKKSQDALVLPGVPVKKEFGTGLKETAELLFPGAGGSKYKVNKMSVSIWLDKGLSQSIVDLVDNLAKQVVGYNETRGDKVEIVPIDFKGEKFYWSSIFYPKNLFILALGLAAALFFLAGASFLSDPLKNLSNAIASVDWDQVRGANAGIEAYSPSYEMEEPGISSDITGAYDAGEQQPFSFISERDLSNLSYLLKDRSAEDIATVANFLEIDLAAKLLESFGTDEQAEVALHLSNEKVDPDGVKKLESEIREQLSYVVGGERKFISLMRLSDDDVREKAMGMMEQKDRDTASRLKTRVKSFDDTISDLPAQGIRALYRRTNPLIFAQIVKGSSDKVIEKILGSLSEGAVERLKQEMELSQPLSPGRLRKERINLMMRLASLMDEGAIEGVNN